MAHELKPWSRAYLWLYQLRLTAICATHLQAVGAGLEQQYGLPTGTAVPGFCVASDLDATADFDALSYEDAESGMLLLRSHVDVRWAWVLVSIWVGRRRGSRCRTRCVGFVKTLPAEERTLPRFAVEFSVSSLHLQEPAQHAARPTCGLMFGVSRDDFGGSQPGCIGGCTALAVIFTSVKIVQCW